MTPDRIYIQFAENGNIRKWQSEPFEDGSCYLAASQEPVAWRWKPRDGEIWIYDPDPEWLEEHRHEVDAAPLYAAPLYAAPVPPVVGEDAREALKTALLNCRTISPARFSPRPPAGAP